MKSTNDLKQKEFKIEKFSAFKLTYEQLNPIVGGSECPSQYGTTRSTSSCQDTGSGDTDADE